MRKKMISQLISIIIVASLFGCRDQDSSELDYISVVLPDGETQGKFDVYGYYLVNANDQFVDENGNLINIDGLYIDADGNIVASPVSGTQGSEALSRVYILTVGPKVNRRGPEHPNGVFHLVRDCSEDEIYSYVDLDKRLTLPKLPNFKNKSYFRFDQGMDLSCDASKGLGAIGDIHVSYDENWNEAYYVETGRGEKEYYKIPYGYCFPDFLTYFLNIEEKQNSIIYDAIPADAKEIELGCVGNNVSETESHKAYRVSENTIVIESKKGMLPLVIHKVDNELISDNHSGYTKLKRKIDEHFGLNFFAPIDGLKLPERYLRYDFCTKDDLESCGTFSISTNDQESTQIRNLSTFYTPDDKDLRVWTAFENSQSSIKQTFNSCSNDLLSRLGMKNMQVTDGSERWLDQKISGFAQWKSKGQSGGYFDCSSGSQRKSNICEIKVVKSLLKQSELQDIFNNSCSDESEKTILKLTLNYDLTIENPEDYEFLELGSRWTDVIIKSDNSRRTLNFQATCTDLTSCFPLGFPFKLKNKNAVSLRLQDLDLTMSSLDSMDLPPKDTYLISLSGNSNGSKLELVNSNIVNSAFPVEIGIYSKGVDVVCIDCSITNVMKGISINSANLTLASSIEESTSIIASKSAILTKKSQGSIFVGDVILKAPFLIEQVGDPSSKSMRVGILDSELEIITPTEGSHYGFSGFGEHRDIVGNVPLESLSIRNSHIKVPTFSPKQLDDFKLISSDCFGPSCQRGTLFKFTGTQFSRIEGDSNDRQEIEIDGRDAELYLGCEKVEDETSKMALFWPGQLPRPKICP